MLLRAVERIIISFSASAAKSVRGARIINSGAAGPELQPAPVTVNRTKTGHKTVHSLTSNFVWPSKCGVYLFAFTSASRVDYCLLWRQECSCSDISSVINMIAEDYCNGPQLCSRAGLAWPVLHWPVQLNS